MSWPERYTTMKQILGWSDTDVAILTGTSLAEVQLAAIGEFSPWLRLAIQLHEAGRRKLELRGQIIERTADLISQNAFTRHHLSLLNSLDDTLSDQEILDFLL